MIDCDTVFKLRRQVSVSVPSQFFFNTSQLSKQIAYLLYTLFPPRIPHINSLTDTLNYQERITRGVENNPTMTPAKAESNTVVVPLRSPIHIFSAHLIACPQCVETAPQADAMCVVGLELWRRQLQHVRELRKAELTELKGL